MFGAQISRAVKFLRTKRGQGSFWKAPSARRLTMCSRLHAAVQSTAASSDEEDTNTSLTSYAGNSWEERVGTALDDLVGAHHRPLRGWERSILNQPPSGILKPTLEPWVVIYGL